MKLCSNFLLFLYHLFQLFLEIPSPSFGDLSRYPGLYVWEFGRNDLIENHNFFSKIGCDIPKQKSHNPTLL
jgi:hypothetical protein